MSEDPTAALLERMRERLESNEGLELEFKAARDTLPKEVWPTVSAFANTNGGWLVLGAAEYRDTVRVEGVANPSYVLKLFHDALRNPNKISFAVCGADDAAIEEMGAKQVLVIRVRAASRKERPIYINGNAYQGTYVRRHSGDYHCTKQEVDRMMREASYVAADSMVLPHFTWDDLDRDTFARYRRRYQTANPGSPINDYDDKAFLQALRGYSRDREAGTEGITVAGILMFGRPEAIREWRTRHLVDYRLLPADAGADTRWTDRLAFDGNLFTAFEQIYPKLVEGQPVPFRLEDGVRVEESPVRTALREALVNLLVHADYGETQASIILRSAAGYYFRNPGSSRVPENDLWASDRSDPRNPALVHMFRMVGLAEEAGTGIPKIIAAWREQGFQLPSIDVGSERYEFTLDLKHVHLISNDDRAWLQTLGTQWSQAEQLALILARHGGEVDNQALRRLTRQHPTDATKVLVSLRDRGILNMLGAGRGARYQLAGLPQAATSAQANPGETKQPANLDSAGSAANSAGSAANSAGTAKVDLDSTWVTLLEIAAPARRKDRLDPTVRDEIIVRLCRVLPLSLTDIARATTRNRSYLRLALSDLVQAGRLVHLHPEPNHPRQKYVAAPVQRQETSTPS